MKPKLVKITEAVRLQTAKDVIIEHRAKQKYQASYELYALNYSDNRLRVRLMDSAPTSADFAPFIKKGRIAVFLQENDMVVEFRGAWKTEEEAEVIAYELSSNA